MLLIFHSFVSLYNVLQQTRILLKDYILYKMLIRLQSLSMSLVHLGQPHLSNTKTHWNRLPKGGVEFPFFEIFET